MAMSTRIEIQMKSKVIYVFLVIAIVFLLIGCSAGADTVNGVPEPRLASASVVASGRNLLANYGCGSCHTIPGVPGANSMAGPPLNRFYERSYVAGRLPNTWDNLAKFIQHPQEIDPGNAMPDLGVSNDEAYDMAAYLYHQLNLRDLILR